VCSNWVQGIEKTVAAAGAHAVLAAHSLACTNAAHWAISHGTPIHGALLVAPSDVEAPSYPLGTTGFAPMPLRKLPFRSIVVSSSNDENVTLERAQKFAASWGSRFVEIGPAGHIDTDSGHGPRPEGELLLQELVRRF
jgi:serine hydrolase